MVQGSEGLLGELCEWIVLWLRGAWGTQGGTVVWIVCENVG